jgi:hypothetical protein
MSFLGLAPFFAFVLQEFFTGFRRLDYAGTTAALNRPGFHGGSQV